ncbi:MAG: hypothetical protein OIN87_07240 [Candidatus Methanoperedens sp.]|nr:hypothetical protein [Candidatus Methanoperedens sp.]
MSKNYIIKFALIFLVFILLAGSVSALSFNTFFGSGSDTLSKQLIEIDQKVNLISGNDRIMKFININMNMKNKNVDTIVISIKENKKIVTSYYIIRAKNINDAAVVTKTPPKKMGTVWNFNPNARQSIDGLNLAQQGVSLYDQHPRSRSDITFFLLKGYFLYISVPSQNVPSMSQIIQNSNCDICRRAVALIGM